MTFKDEVENSAWAGKNRDFILQFCKLIICEFMEDQVAILKSNRALASPAEDEFVTTSLAHISDPFCPRSFAFIEKWSDLVEESTLCLGICT